jgi:hypothetical protein
MDTLRYFFVNLESAEEQRYAPRVASSIRS